MFTVDVKQQCNDNKIFTCQKNDKILKFSFAKFHKNFHPSHVIFRIQRQRANSVDLDEMAHDEPPHQDLHCLQVYLFSSLVIKELRPFLLVSCLN